MNLQRNLTRLGHPIFLLAMATLIANDWYFKQTYHNWITGKLSDVAGLFAFPFFLTALFPRWRIGLHVFTAIGFAAWKSELSSPIVQVVNSWGIPISRVCDLTDLVALTSVAVSLYWPPSDCTFFKQRYALVLILVSSCVSFVATTLPPRSQYRYIVVDKEYNFDMSKRALVASLNSIQLHEIKNIANHLDFDSEENVFRLRGRTDTVAILIDYRNVEDNDTITYKTSLAKITIHGDTTKSTLKLIHISWFGPMGSKKDFKEKAISTFEKKVVKKIKIHSKQTLGI